MRINLAQLTKPTFPLHTLSDVVLCHILNNFKVKPTASILLRLSSQNLHTVQRSASTHYVGIVAFHSHGASQPYFYSITLFKPNLYNFILTGGSVPEE
jgi:hypothetical protein